MNALDHQQVVFEPELMRKLDRNGPRYTSYPTADRFSDDFDGPVYRAWSARRNGTGIQRPLSLYVHLPFCASLCYYCACNKIVTRDAAKADRYLRYLTREIALQAALFRDDARVADMHWGGGTPTFYGLNELGGLMQTLRSHFELAGDGEYSIEIDPRTVSAETVAALRELGFNRVSFGVQDVDPHVQRAVNRVQSPEQTEKLIEAARASGFDSINLDLIYGLPRQTPETFASTLEWVAAMRPDRLAVYSYAHLPTRFKAQRQIDQSGLPGAETKLHLLGLAVERLTRAGYVYIGMDHFALPDDALAIAQSHGRLYRNFQGYSTRGDSDLVGLGISAIGAIGPTYSQNARTLSDYYARLERNEIPVVRGVELTRDDLVRRRVIHALLCQFEVSKEAIGVGYLIDFDDYFCAELEQLEDLQRAGLVTLSDDWISVTPKGRMLVRNVCMIFDRYLRREGELQRYSRTI